MTVEDLRERVAELSAMEARLQDCLADVRAAGDIAVEELAVAAKQDMGLRPLGAKGTPDGFTHRNIRLEEVRDAVVTLRVFTIGELAAELGCSTSRARKELDRVMHLVNPAGRMGSRQMWAYCVPDGPGKAFEAQQKLRQVEPGDQAPVGPHDIKQSILSMISAKELKEVAREAIRDGWELVHVGGKHPLSLVKPGHKPIVLSSTPRNPSGAARAVRRQLRGAA